MAATPETGFLIIADLTGYTTYLSRSELEHAPAIAGDLLETVVGRRVTGGASRPAAGQGGAALSDPSLSPVVMRRAV